MARRSLQPLDLTLRHGRRYQWARRLFLGFSVLLTFGLPLLHLRTAVAEGAGLAGDSPWAAATSALPATAPPFVGAPTSIAVFGIELVDPLAWLGVALQRGVNGTMVWTVLPGLLLVVLLGRFFCGWACPYLPILAASNAGVPALLPGVPVPRSRGGGRRPLFHADACVGGGLCEEACPEIAQAIVIEPIPHEA